MKKLKKENKFMNFVKKWNENEKFRGAFLWLILGSTFIGSIIFNNFLISFFGLISMIIFTGIMKKIYLKNISKDILNQFKDMPFNVVSDKDNKNINKGDCSEC